MFYDIKRDPCDLYSLLIGGAFDTHHRGQRHHAPEHGLMGRGRPHSRHGLHSGRKLSAADLQLVLLALLLQAPRHGYELIKSLEELSDGFYVPSPGMIYPALTYLTEIGFTAVEAEGNKKLYRVTESGEAHFAANRAMAAQILNDLERIGAQMVHARRALTRPTFADDAGDEIETEGEDDGGISDELEAIRRELRRAQRERGPLTTEESQRIAGILDRAATEIRLGPQSSSPPPGHRVHPPHHDHASHLARLAGAHAGLEGKRQIDPATENELGSFVSPAQADFIYLLCRALGATRVAESATSVGLSAMYLTTAVRDNSGGRVIGSESVPEKAQTARRNLAEAGLADLVEVREGDARETLRDLGGPIDLLLLSGDPAPNGEPTARQILEIVAPQLRINGVVLTANGEPGYLAYLRDPANGFCSMPLPFKEATELSVKVK